MNTNRDNVIDLNTTDGLYEHLSSLPSVNLEAIAARPIWDADSATMATVAGMILATREVSR